MEQHLFNHLSRRLSSPPVTPTLFHLDRAWRTAYEVLLKFAEREGHLQIPASVTVDGLPLAKWQVSQISRYHNRTLSHEKTRLLERIPGWQWSDRDAAPRGQEKEDGPLDALAEKQFPARRIITPSADQPQTRRILQPSVERAKSREKLPSPPSQKIPTSTPLPKGWMQGLSSLLAFVDRIGTAGKPGTVLRSFTCQGRSMRYASVV